jgi:hypothetical protein
MMLVVSFGYAPAMATVHPVPKDRTTLSDRDWLPHVISKIAPLEWWSFASSPAEIRREDYPSDFRYQVAKQDTWHFPQFCFSLFRPGLEVFSSLIAAVNEYSGDVIWSMSDECITAVPGTPGKIARHLVAPPVAASLPVEDLKKFEELARNPPQADPEFVKRAMLDAPRFAAYLEQRLGLKDKPSIDFDSQWLTREGLAASRGQYEDYLEPGSWSVFLASSPQEYAKTSRPTSDRDRSLSIGIGMDGQAALLKELGADWDSYQQDEMDAPLVPAYPLLSRLSDYTADTFYERDEIDALFAETLRAQAKVKDPQAIRTLDNLIRVVRWAQKLKVGIYFGGQ